MGWIALALIGIAAAALLWRMGVPRMLWTTAAAALMLGAAGYAVQGSPNRPASPAKPKREAMEIAAEVATLRGQIFSRFTADSAYETAADAMLRAGLPGNAVKVTLGGLDRYPRSIQLWTELGSVLVAHDGGNVSPAALFAFRRAMQLNPRHPGPPFFLGLGYIQAGQFPEARKAWVRALKLTPPNASYRNEIAERIVLLDQFMAMAARQPQFQAQPER